MKGWHHILDFKVIFILKMDDVLINKQFLWGLWNALISFEIAQRFWDISLVEYQWNLSNTPTFLETII